MTDENLIAENEILAKVRGEPVTAFPKDLYIPPDALEVFLEAFEGPLDLLLYLIKKQNLEILDIPIAEITRQYMQYVEMMKNLQLELAAEYLLMAGTLAELKSRMLLPRHNENAEDEDDPRAELIRRLQEYERFKQAAEDIDSLARIDRDLFVAQATKPEIQKTKPQPPVDVRDLWFALRDVLARAQMFSEHQIRKDALSTRERMSQILTRLEAEKFTNFINLFTVEEGKAGVIVTFSAILELIRQSMIELVQAEPYSKIYVKKVG